MSNRYAREKDREKRENYYTNWYTRKNDTNWYTRKNDANWYTRIGINKLLPSVSLHKSE